MIPDEQVFACTPKFELPEKQCAPWTTALLAKSLPLLYHSILLQDLGNS